VIAAEGEQKASRALKEASDIINESSSALQLRYLQTLNTISAEKNSTIIFPLPIELLQNFMRPPANSRRDAVDDKDGSRHCKKADCA
jgi:erythrocyte band 7 integral membrane protein